MAEEERLVDDLWRRGQPMILSLRSSWLWFLAPAVKALAAGLGGCPRHADLHQARPRHEEEREPRSAFSESLNKRSLTDRCRRRRSGIRP